MTYKYSGVRKRLATIGIIFAALALVSFFGLLGCRIIQPYWSDNTREGVPGQTGRYTIAGEGALDIRSDTFRLVIPPGAAVEGTTLTLSTILEPTFIINPSQTTQTRVLPPTGFVKLSSTYDVTISPASTILTRPARLEIPFQSDAQAISYPGSILVACLHETDGWSLLVPAIDLDRGLAVVETTRFGRWMVVRPADPGFTVPRLTAVAAPETLIASYGHSFTSDIVVTYSAADLNPGSVVSNELTIVGVNGVLPPGRTPGSSDSKAFTTDVLGHVVLALNNSPFIGRTSSGNSLIYTIRFATSGLNPEELADRLVMRWVVKRADGFSFIREFPVTLTEAVIPASSSTAGNPQLVAFSPRDAAVGVPAYTPIEMTFDLEMNRESVVQATTVSPSPAAPNAVWTDNRHLLLSFPEPWPPETLVTVSLASSAVSIDGTKPAREYRWSFTVRDPSGQLPPGLSAIAPASGSPQVAINTRILLRFSKPMIRSAVEAAIVAVRPAISQFTFEWSADHTSVGILPATLWEAETNHEIEIGASAADTDGLPLAGPIRFTFRTTAESGPTVALIEPVPGSILATSPNSLKFLFSRTMNRTLTAGALSVIPAPEGTPTFGWASADSELSITWPNSFPQGREIIASFSSAARDSTNLPLSGTTLFRFFTRDSTPPRIVSAAPADSSIGNDRNAPIELTFSEAMNRTAVESAILISPSMDSLTYQWDSTGTRLTITSAQPWPADSQILLTAGTSTADESGNTLPEQFILSFRSGSAFAPVLAASNPSSGATGVSRAQPLSLTFSQPMLAESLAGAMLIAPPPAEGVSITWSADSTVATVTPRPSWANAASVAVTIGRSAQNSTGIGLVATASVLFSTIDSEAPSVVSISPGNGAVSVSTTASLTILFSEPMNEATVLAAVSLTPAAAGTRRSRVSDGGRLFEISWSQPLSGLTDYTLAIGTGARDTSGIPLSQPISSIFTTIDTSFSDSTPPTILSGQEVPRANSTFVASSTIISLPFSTAMNTASVESAFSLKAGAVAVAGSSRWESNRFIFTPSAPLSNGQVYEVRVAGSATRDNGVSIAAAWVATFTTAPDTAPVLASTVPADGAANVSAHQDIVLEFSAAMATGTLSVTVTPEALGQRTDTWSGDLRRLTISYTGGFSSNTSYQVTIGNGARNVVGTAISGNLDVAFTSETTIAPKVLAVSPAVGATDVQRTASLSLTFDMAMDRASTSAALTMTPAPGESPTITWSSGDTVVTLSWPGGLALGTVYTVQLAGTARSATGIALGNAFSSYFTVESRPQLVSGSEYPAPGATNVATDTVVRMRFSKPMNQVSVASAFRMTAGGNVVSGSITWADTLMTFTPSAVIPASTSCIVTVSTAALDGSGNTIVAPVSWQFDTVTLSGTVWRQVLANDFTATDRFSPRRGHATVSFNNRLWVIGGTDGSTFFNDVWSSSDGILWTPELAHSEASGSTQFGGRTNHACAVFNGRIWLTGGYIDTGSGIDVIDDVWSSADGVTWRLDSATAEYWARGDHNMFVFDGKLWMVAGQTYDGDGLETLLNDAWYSSDGAHWTEASPVSSYFPRRLAAAGVIGGKMFIWGGYGTDAAGAAGPLGDIWYSTNGSSWALSTVAAPFAARHGAAHAVIDGKVWMMGGFGIAPTGFDECLNDVWTSGDGISWYNLLAHDSTAAGRFTPRQQAGVAQAGGKVFLVGGEELYDILNDIWTFD